MKVSTKIINVFSHFGVIVILLMSFFSACSAQTEAQKEIEQNSPDNQLQKKGDTNTEKQIRTSEWKIYKDSKSGFSFHYPPNLILQKKRNGTIRLYHTVDFNHQDPCDGRDKPPVLKKLVDFDLTLKVTNGNFYKRKFTDDDTDAETEFGKLNREGKVIEHSYDGCGYYEYVFPFGENKSIVLEHQIVGLFSPIYTAFPGAEAARRLPDLIKSDKIIIKGILESFTDLKK